MEGEYKSTGALSCWCKIFLSLQKNFVDVTANRTSGQSYKHFTLVNYDSRVVIWGIFQSGMTLES